MNLPVTNIRQLKKTANRIRQNVIKMLSKAKSGHSGGSLGMADVFCALYFNILKHDPKRPNWKERDRVILSNGHICPVWYATLAEVGYFSKRELWTLRELGSHLQGHPHRNDLPGIENTAGPLGQGISVAAGLAYALCYLDNPSPLLTQPSPRRGEGYSSPCVFCLTSDGEHNEGQVWEAVMFAAKYHLSNLIVIIDRNSIQIDGPTETVMPLDFLRAKYEAFNWKVLEVDGHNIQDIIDTCSQARATTDRPTCIIASTIPGKGVSFMENDYRWHGQAPNAQQAEEALQQLL